MKKNVLDLMFDSALPMSWPRVNLAGMLIHNLTQRRVEQIEWLVQRVAAFFGPDKPLLEYLLDSVRKEAEASVRRLKRTNKN